MTILRRYWLALLFALAGMVLAACVYDRLPSRLPVHWGLNGQPDGWMPKPRGAFLLPASTLVITLLMILAPSFRWGFGDKRAVPRIYPALVATTAGSLLFLTAVQLLIAMGAPLPFPRLLGAALGVLFAVTGNYMGKVPRNGLVGIRLPWTLASDEVWERTHRFAAPVMVAGGLCMFVVSVAHDIRTTLPVLVILGVTVTIPVVKSYLIWRSIGGSQR